MNSKPYKSKLLPYINLIKKWRQKGHSYTEIAMMLQERYGVTTTRHNIFYFVKARMTKRKVIEIADSFGKIEEVLISPELENDNLLGGKYEENKPEPISKKKEITKKEEELTPEQKEKAERWEKVRMAAREDFIKTW